MTLSTRNEDGQHWPLLRSLAGWRISSLPADLAAGLTLAAIAIPEQMATAKLGGFTPETGFFAFMAGSLGFCWCSPEASGSAASRICCRCR